MDIEITRSGKWEVQVDGVVTSTHTQAKEGYENLVEQTIKHPTKTVRLIPNFVERCEITAAEESFTLTEAQIEQYIRDIPHFEPGKEYEYVLFELDNEGLKNFTPVKNIII